MSDKTRIIAQEGIKYFGYQIARFGGLVRETGDHDKGIDAELEIVGRSLVDGKTPFLGIQVKSRSKAKRLLNGDFTITVTDQNIKYWKRYGRPVLLVLYDIKAGELYWQRVDISQQKTIHISKKSVLDQTSIHLFLEFCHKLNVSHAQDLNLVDIDPVLSILATTYGGLSEKIKEKLKCFYEAYENNQFEKACKKIQPIAELYDSSKEIISNCALVYFRANNALSLDYAERLLTLVDLQANDYEIAASCHAQFGDYSKSIQLFSKAIELDSSPRILNNFALSCYWHGDYDQAYSILSQIDIDNMDDKNLFNYALISTALENYQRALELYDLAIEKNSTLSDAYNNKGLLLKKLGTHTLALETFEKGILSCSDDFSLLINYASLLKDYGENEKSLSLYNKLTTIRDEWIVWRDIGFIYCRLGRLNEAETIFTLNYDNIFSYIDDGASCVLMDIGFTVMYQINFELVDKIVKIKDVIDMSSDSPLNYLRTEATIIGIPYEILEKEFLKTENPKGAFAPK